MCMTSEYNNASIITAESTRFPRNTRLLTRHCKGIKTITRYVCRVSNSRVLYVFVALLYLHSNCDDIIYIQPVVYLSCST